VCLVQRVDLVFSFSSLEFAGVRLIVELRTGLDHIGVLFTGVFGV
jgi:hypothetical protein